MWRNAQMRAHRLDQLQISARVLRTPASVGVTVRAMCTFGFVPTRIYFDSKQPSYTPSNRITSPYSGGTYSRNYSLQIAVTPATFALYVCTLTCATLLLLNYSHSCGCVQ